MTSLKAPHIALTLAFLLALTSACTTNDKRPRQEPTAHFNTNITADGTKFFVYRVEMPQRDAQGEPRGRPQGGGRGGSGGPPGQSRGPSQDARDNDDDLLKQQVDLLIAKNRFCRDGYFVLDQYDGAGGTSMRGECREEASPEDRTRFPNPV